MKSESEYQDVAIAEVCFLQTDLEYSVPLTSVSGVDQDLLRSYCPKDMRDCHPTMFSVLGCPYCVWNQCKSNRTEEADVSRDASKSRQAAYIRRTLSKQFVELLNFARNPLGFSHPLPACF